MRPLFRLIRLVLWLPCLAVVALFIASNTQTVSISTGFLGLSYDLPLYLLPVMALVIGIAVGGIWMRFRR